VDGAQHLLGKVQSLVDYVGPRASASALVRAIPRFPWGVQGRVAAAGNRT
jgi:hypothetical protein